MKTTTFTSAVASLYLLALVSSCSDDQMSVSNADMEIKRNKWLLKKPVSFIRILWNLKIH